MKTICAVIALLLASWAPALPAAPAQPSPASTAPASLSPDQLFSRRALRRARLIIQMRLLQLHEERLDCVRAALLRELGAAGVLPPETSASDKQASRGRFATICDFFPLPG